jgi:hypothetical protein
MCVCVCVCVCVCAGFFYFDIWAGVAAGLQSPSSVFWFLHRPNCSWTTHVLQFEEASFSETSLTLYQSIRRYLRRYGSALTLL